MVLRKLAAVPPSRTAVLLGTTVVLPLLIGALGASIYGLWVHAGWIGLSDVEPWDKERVMLQRLRQADHLLIVAMRRRTKRCRLDPTPPARS